MYVSFNWPEPGQLPVSEAVYTELISHLLEAFDSEDSAKRYWNDIPTVLIILEAKDSSDAIKNETDELQNQIAFALAYPEFVTPIGEHYRLALAIFSDEGSGIYLLIHNLNPIAKELDDA